MEPQGQLPGEPDYRATNKSCLDLRMRMSLNVDLCPDSKSEARAAPQSSITTAACTLGLPHCGHLSGQSGLLWPISKAIFLQAALLPTCSAQDLSWGQLTWMGPEDSKLSTSKP